MKVGDLVTYTKSFYESHGFSAQSVFESCGFGIIQKVDPLPGKYEGACLYVIWSRGHDCWEYPDELEVISEGR